MEHPKDTGDRSTLAIILALRSLGYRVAVPFGENARYDLIVDDGRRLARVQCKTGRLTRDTIEFKTASSYYHHPTERRGQRHYVGQVDLFAVYCRETTGVYLVPIGDLPLDRAYLRLNPPRNGQRKRIRFATDYEIARVGCTGPSQGALGDERRDRVIHGEAEATTDGAPSPWIE